MQKTIEQLQVELDREKEYTTRLNRQIDCLRDQLRNTISLAEHEKLLAAVKGDYDAKLTEIKIQHQKPHNERGAGRKRKATKEMMERVKALHVKGLSQQNIAQAVSDELGISISRTTVGEIVRGEHDGRK